MVGRVFLGRYQTIRLLGEGGMGRVYLARQLDLGRQVVVKVMHDHLSADSKFCERFQRETLLMARFQHPYAVTLYDASLNDPEGPCIVMEYIRGIDLDALIRNNQGRLSPPRVGRLLGQLCEVLHAAHNEGIIHRDLKPANLMVVDADTPYEKIKVMDFGLAKLADSPSIKHGDVTGTDFAVGTPAYISPEQVRGEKVDNRSDLYSVGVILYQLLTGKVPFGELSSMEVLIAHATEEPEPFPEGDGLPYIPRPIQEVVLSCLAKAAADRPGTARELAERYETALTQEDLGCDGNSSEDTLPADGAGISGQVEEDTDPNSIVYRLEAWMPESVAVYKLRGFMYDVGGEVTASVPGRICVLLGGADSAYQIPGRNSWFGRPKKSSRTEMDLRMFHTDPLRPNLLGITVFMRPSNGNSAFDPAWRSYAAQIFIDLRGYLMGQSGIMEQVK